MFDNPIHQELQKPWGGSPFTGGLGRQLCSLLVLYAAGALFTCTLGLQGHWPGTRLKPPRRTAFGQKYSICAPAMVFTMLVPSQSLIWRPVCLTR